MLPCGRLYCLCSLAAYLCGGAWFALEGASMYVAGPALARYWVRSGGGDEREVASTWCFLQASIYGAVAANLAVRSVFKKRKTS